MTIEQPKENPYQQVPIIDRPKVYVGLPTGDEKSATPQTFPLMNLQGEGASIIMAFCFSAITYAFNWLWADALNARARRGVTHFLLLHADVIPEQGFLSKMLKIMEDHKCDVLSAVIPIKSPQGLTSTGFIPDDNNEWRVRRFTMKECYNFPETFTHPKIVVNTGCLLIDMRKPWVEQIFFTIQDKLVKTPDGKGWIAHFQPEDWNFSIRARKLGASIYATRGIKCQHVGIAKYDNCSAWGREETDPNFKNIVLNTTEKKEE